MLYYFSLIMLIYFVNMWFILLYLGTKRLKMITLYIANNYFDGLVQERCNSSALAMELCLSCTDLSICNVFIVVIEVEVNYKSKLGNLYLFLWPICFSIAKKKSVHYSYQYS